MKQHLFALKPQHNIKKALAELLFKKQLSYKFGETAAKAWTKADVTKIK